VAIYRKDHVDPYLRELERFYRELRNAVEGDPPNPDLAHLYHANPEQFEREYTSIDLDRVITRIEHFKVAVEALKQLKKKAAKPVHR